LSSIYDWAQEDETSLIIDIIGVTNGNIYISDLVGFTLLYTKNPILLIKESINKFKSIEPLEVVSYQEYCAFCQSKYIPIAIALVCYFLFSFPKFNKINIAEYKEWMGKKPLNQAMLSMSIRLSMPPSIVPIMNSIAKYDKSDLDINKQLNDILTFEDKDQNRLLSINAFKRALNNLNIKFEGKSVEILFNYYAKDDWLNIDDFLEKVGKYIPQETEMPEEKIENLKSTPLEVPKPVHPMNSLLANKDQQNLLKSMTKSGEYIEGIVLDKSIMEKPLNYFNKESKTILSDVTSTIIKCHQIMNEMFKAKQTRFKDTEFGSQTNDPGDLSNKTSICIDISNPPSKIDLEKIEWLYPNEINIEGKNLDASFIKDGLTSSDVIQGSLGDCWFISALSVLASRSEYFGLVSKNDQKFIKDIDLNNHEPFFDEGETSILLTMVKGIYPPVFHYFRKFGIYVFAFHKNMGTAYVIVGNHLIRSANPLYQGL
jgi:hypothetical protein